MPSAPVAAPCCILWLSIDRKCYPSMWWLQTISLRGTMNTQSGGWTLPPDTSLKSPPTTLRGKFNSVLSHQHFGWQHFSRRSSVAEYPFSTLTSLGATLPPPVHNSRERSSSSAIVMSIKILSTIFLAACFIVAIFYFAMFVRKWNRKRGKETCN